ncbi:small, acid-soluble spore protein, alpha/beta type [Cohnella sp. CFH 77786]|uniref:alpha/beta-type small acid-soluble spore protein n=1 Tax=Cohnella sp. CFH 77786 TaxID=2662265 RepID=UPI001C608DD8|nr:alpha/beta-type small acid-soluble spore protein [Cohnella sp. CFH 77786]MBW5448621.1 small, acid-soluble spore protein, alpha/beta type [Cohnella sp. CFH 77786]
MPNRNQYVVKNARGALDRLKFEVAQQLTIPLDQAYNGDKTSRDMGAIGGNMVRRMIQIAEQQLVGGTGRF